MSLTPPAFRARATSVAAPSPTMRATCSSDSAGAPYSTSSRLTESVRSRRESISVPSRSKTNSRKSEVVRRKSLDSKLRKRRRCRPDGDADDGKSRLFGLIEDELCDPLDRWIAVDDEDGLAELPERRDERVVVPQDHLVIELPVDPPLDHPLDVAEIADHIPVVERAGADLDLGDGVVAVGMLTDAVVVEQTMAVAEVDALGNAIHVRIWFSAYLVIDWKIEAKSPNSVTRLPDNPMTK